LTDLTPRFPVMYMTSNEGPQLIVGSPGSPSQRIPYVSLGPGSIIGFTIALDSSSLSDGVYLFHITVNSFGSTIPTPGTIRATVTVTLSGLGGGGKEFSATSVYTDVGPHVGVSFNGTAGTITTLWTTVGSLNMVREDRLSLYLQSGVTGLNASLTGGLSAIFLHPQ
jgi:hypothetical protein